MSDQSSLNILERDPARPASPVGREVRRRQFLPIAGCSNPSVHHPCAACLPELAATAFGERIRASISHGSPSSAALMRSKSKLSNLWLLGKTTHCGGLSFGGR